LSSKPGALKIVQETSVNAYFDLDLGKRQLEVYHALEALSYATNTMLANKLHLPINQITGRTNELRKKGLVIESHRSWCPITKNKCIYWTIKH